jgi:hypothetical protein
MDCGVFSAIRIDEPVFDAKADPDALDRYAAARGMRAICGLPSADRETVRPILDRYSTLVR